MLQKACVGRGSLGHLNPIKQKQIWKGTGMGETREEWKEPEVREDKTTETRQETGRKPDKKAYEECVEFGKEELLEFLRKGQYTRLRQVIQEWNDADIADYIEDMDEEEIVKIFRILPKDLAASVFSYLEIEVQQFVITSLSDKDAGNIIDNMMSDDACQCGEKADCQYKSGHP